MRRFLFVCAANRARSPTAERVFALLPGVEARSAGLDVLARVSLSTELVAWADVIFVMESGQRSRLRRRFAAAVEGKRIVVLGIPDEYEFMDPALVAILEARAEEWRE